IRDRTVTGVQTCALPIYAKKGATVSVKGKIERREGLKGDVAVNLTGLPPGAKADAVNVKADAAVFTVNVVLPPTLAAGEIKGLKIGRASCRESGGIEVVA